jgi:hypothetical protein
MSGIDTKKFMLGSTSASIYDRKKLQTGTDVARQEVLTDGREGQWAVPNLGLFIDSEMRLSNIQNKNQNFAFTMEFSREVTQSVTRVSNINDRLNQLLRITRNSNPFSMPHFKSGVQDMLAELTGVLNKRFLGESLLGGTDTRSDVAKDLTTLGALPSNASPEDHLDYYIGNTETCDLDLDGQRHIRLFEVNALHPFIQKTITALRICLNAAPDDPFDPCIESALTLSSEAQKEYGNALESTAHITSVVQEAVDDNRLQEVITTEFFKATGIKDKHEALARLSEYEANMKISMNMTISESIELKKFIESIGNR